MDDPSRYRSSVVDQCYESYQSCGAAQFVTAASHCGDTTILADKPFPWQASAINLVADHVAKQGGRLGVLVVAAVGMGKTLAAGEMLAAWERQSPVQAGCGAGGVLHGASAHGLIPTVEGHSQVVPMSCRAEAYESPTPNGTLRARPRAPVHEQPSWPQSRSFG